MAETSFQIVENSAEDVLDQYLIDQSGLLQLSTQQKLQLGYKIDQFSDNRHLPKYIPIFKTLFVCLGQKIEEMTKEQILEEKLDKVSNKIDNIGQEIGKISKTAKPANTQPSRAFPPSSYAQAASYNSASIQPKLENTKTIIVKPKIPNTSPKVIERQLKTVITEAKANPRITSIRTNKTAVVIRSAET
ncbi:hypothetical protein QR98_0003450, partial [Sarcoptes scabiei]